MAAVPLHSRHRLLRLGAFLALLALAAVQLRIALPEQAEYSDAGAAAAMLDALRSPFLLTWHGKQLHQLQGQTEAAEGLYRRALVHNPLYLPAWLGLAELDNDRGRTAEATAILRHVDSLAAGINRWRWDKALLAYQLGDSDILSQDLAWIIAEIPAQRDNALKLAFGLWPEPAALLAQVGQANVVHLFSHAARTGRTEAALAWWPEIEQLGVDNHRPEVLAFLTSLINHERLTDAAPIWRRYFNGATLLTNGDFAREPGNTAFDWRISAPKGSSWRIEAAGDGKGQAMRLHFSGTNNLGFRHLSQIVPLESGHRYRLTAQVKSEGLTTDQRPYLEVAGFQCPMAPVRSEIVAVSQPWTDLTLPFEVPPDCRAVQVRVRRDRSNHLDNLIAGDLWLRQLTITKTGEIHATPVVEAQ
ncbi:hypothetical protein JWG42_16715 [Desulfoprunum benzoelyticum]|uniref:Tetratricopeptide (TPR) repeat protein n=1 Tax=Desulfoprunum benzoelyticum TaxID=1506996 RepID=A0A840UR13_9BACT|nr:tetratricopeptide repeat protein [Desulfoprunum benzoelyticum]MBB5348085.1 tetratricopeptide (TPR) repeat protein [Desulfoprunum benzoelyticum]MBM9531803.1 hypothetical protein [Desulfoprunum benzoelyticum]